MPAPERSKLPSVGQLYELIVSTSGKVLEASTDPAVRVRVLRDVLLRPAHEHELVAAMKELHASPQALAILDAQLDDGGWGRFHSMDSHRRQPIPTTEWAVERALALGLDGRHPPLKRTARYIYDLMTWKLEFPDPPEKNNRWPIGIRLFLASTLARIQPTSPILTKERRFWRMIAEQAFADGRYSSRAEEAAHLKLTGTYVTGSYLVLNGRYQLQLLGSQPGLLPVDLQDHLLHWLWSLPQGLGYLNVPLGAAPRQSSNIIDRWLASHQLLADCFPGWADRAGPMLVWLWNQRQANGQWDFGPRPARSPYLPLTASWRRPGSRTTDWTVRVLLIFSRYVQRKQAGGAGGSGS